MSGGWWRNEIPAMLRGLPLLVRSQLGYELRQSEKKLKEKLLQRVVMGGEVIDPSNPASNADYPTDMYGSWLPPTLRDAAERVQVVAIGVKSIAGLMLNGHIPGYAGRIEPIEAVESQMSTSVEEPQRIDLTEEELQLLRKATHEVTIHHPLPRKDAASTSAPPKKSFYQPKLPKGYKLDIPEMTELKNRERRVPSSRIARLLTFGQLGVGLAAGAAAEVTRRAFTFNKVNESQTADRILTNPLLTQANAEKIVQTLCRVRGAALKLGQMLSIQDSDTISPVWQKIFERVRHSADFMPVRQVHRQLRRDLGDNWRDNFMEFDDKPFAAASIGQVHHAKLLDGRRVAIKIQYPGVAEGIDSDINNLITVLNIGGIFPKGLYLENFVEVARKELKLECDYKREGRAIKKFAELLADDNAFYVPKVIEELTTTRVLTAEYVEGVPVDSCASEPQEVRDYIAAKFIELCLHEVFVWRFMQTDPNWSNFLFGRHPINGEPRLILLDFGASLSYPKKFVDQYMRIIKAAYDHDRKTMLKYSQEIGFLTGFESKVMEDAHCESILILGETLASSKPYDFSKQTVTKRINKLIPVMLEHRLKSPPKEVYSLHRKLSGAYLLAAKLNAVVSCGALFESIYDSYEFGEEGFEDIDIDSVNDSDNQIGDSSSDNTSESQQNDVKKSTV